MFKKYFFKINPRKLPSKYKLKGFLNVIGSIIIYLIFGSLYAWSNINVYLVSYLKQYKSPNIEIVDGYFIMPIIIVISNISKYFGSKIEEKLELKKCLLLSLVMICGSHFGLLFTTRLIFVFSLMIIFGIAIGFSEFAVMKNAWYFYPHKKGFISGIISFGYGVSSMIFSGIADNIINPKNEATETNGFFNKTISDNTFSYLKQLNIILYVMSLIGFLLISDYNKINNQNKISQEKIIKDTKNSSLIIKQVFKRRQIWLIIFSNFSALYFLYIIANTNRSFGQLFSINNKLLSNLSKFYSFINGVGRIIWGFLLDRFELKKLYYFIIFFEIIISSTIFYAGNYQYLYFLMICICSFLFSGIVVILIIIYPKVYGIKYSNKIYGIGSAITGFSSLLGPIASKVLIKETNDYKKIYFSGTLLSFLCLINLYFLSLKEFKYRFE